MPRSPEDLLDALERADPSLWPDPARALGRLGWLRAPRHSVRRAKELRRWAETIDQGSVLIIGAGAPVAAATAMAQFADRDHLSPRSFSSLDTTDPETVHDAPFEDAFVLVIAPATATIETEALVAYARTRVRDPRRLAVVAGASTPLARLGDALRVNRLEETDPTPTGPFGALGEAGSLIAALAGYDLEEFFGRALEIDRHEAVTFGLEIGEQALDGDDRRAVVFGPDEEGLARWTALLLAESTGQHRAGVVPFLVPQGSSLRTPAIGFDPMAAHELGAAFARAEIAAAIAAHVLRSDPFDESHLREQEGSTGALLAEPPLPSVASIHPDELEVVLKEAAEQGVFVSIEAYLPYSCAAQLDSLGTSVRRTHPTLDLSVSFAPRSLHERARISRDGPPSVMTVQLVARSDRPDLPVPGRAFDFATLISAQSIAARQALETLQRTVVTVALDEVGELL